MKKSVLLSALVILAVVALTATVTWAYFSSNTTETATLTTALIGIGETGGFPINFDKVLPGESKVLEFSAKNIGNREADFYAQMVGWTGDESNPAYLNFCLGSLGFNAVRVTVQELDTAGGTPMVTWINNEQICNLYPGHSASVIRQIANDVGVGVRKYYRITLTLNAFAGNEYMNKFNTDYVNLIAVQYNGPNPMPDKDSYYSAWPTDTGTDDDPNY